VTDKQFAGARGPNFTKLGEDVGRNLFQRSDILLRFKRERLKVEWCWKSLQISQFWPPPVKIRVWVGEISTPIVEALPRRFRDCSGR